MNIYESKNIYFYKIKRILLGNKKLFKKLNELKRYFE